MIFLKSSFTIKYDLSQNFEDYLHLRNPLYQKEQFKKKKNKKPQVITSIDAEKTIKFDTHY